MITKEDISRIDWEAVKHTDKDFVASTAFVEMTQAAYELLKERDEALAKLEMMTSLAQLQLDTALAYREIAIKEREHDFADLPPLEEARLAKESVDEQAQKIMAGRKDQK